MSAIISFSGYARLQLYSAKSFSISYLISTCLLKIHLHHPGARSLLETWAAAAGGVKRLLLSSMGATCTRFWHSHLWLMTQLNLLDLANLKNKKQGFLVLTTEAQKVNVSEAKHLRTAAIPIDPLSGRRWGTWRTWTQGGSSKRRSTNFHFISWLWENGDKKRLQVYYLGKKELLYNWPQPHTSTQQAHKRAPGHTESTTLKERWYFMYWPGNSLHSPADLSWIRGQWPPGNFPSTARKQCLSLSLDDAGVWRRILAYIPDALRFEGSVTEDMGNL